MTIAEAWAQLEARESGGKLDCIGDDGRAGGVGQMWWVYRQTWWPAWCWEVLAAMDYLGFRKQVQYELRKAKVSGTTLSLRTFYEHHYNPGSNAPELSSDSIEIAS